MNRLLATTAILALCTAAPMATSARADDAAPPATNTAQPSFKVALDQQIHNAQVLRMKGNFADAAKALGQIMLVAPDDARVLGEYGKTLAQQGKSQQAVEFLNRAVQIRNNDWTTYSALGVAYDQLDKRTEAREAYDRALALKPGEPSVINNYAVSRMLAGDYAGAQKMLMQLQASGTSDPKVAGNLAKLAQLEAGKPPAKTPQAVAAAKSDPHTTMVQKLAAGSNVAAAQSPVAVAALPPPPAKGGVMMQAIPVDPKAGPVIKSAAATHAPAALAAEAKRPVSTSVEPAATRLETKMAAGKVLMQKVPTDPLAGPIAPHVAATQKPKTVTAAKSAPKTKAVLAKAEEAPAHIAPPPALRTASEPD